MKSWICFSLCVICAQLLLQSHGLSILSFNVRQFGVTKYSRQEVVDTLIKIVQQYDVVLIMELVDVSQTVWPGFMEQLNQNVSSKGLIFNSTVSIRVGRSNYKEQYAFLYRPDIVNISNTFQYSDPDDLFEREPYAILVENLNTSNGNLSQFFIVASHTRPTDAVVEINALYDVFSEASLYFSTDRGMILGDLNADCSYVSMSAYLTLNLVVDSSFTWWIGSDIDTTTGSSDCAYDRIITSSALTRDVVNETVHVVLFDELYNLNEEETADVSDHYPLHVALQGEPIIPSSTEPATSVTLSQTPTTAPATSTATPSPTATSTATLTDAALAVACSPVLMVALMLLSSISVFFNDNFYF